jgi:hypothetical protein
MCDCNDGTNTKNDATKKKHLSTENIINGSRSSKWNGHIKPGIHVPTIPLTSLRNLDTTSIKQIDKTIPNMIDESKYSLAAADVSDINALFSIVNDNLPGKKWRCKMELKQYTNNELNRMCSYAHKILEMVCKKIMPNDYKSFLEYLFEGSQTDWADIANRWTDIAKESQAKSQFSQAKSKNKK